MWGLGSLAQDQRLPGWPWAYGPPSLAASAPLSSSRLESQGPQSSGPAPVPSSTHLHILGMLSGFEGQWVCRAGRPCGGAS